MNKLGAFILGIVITAVFLTLYFTYPPFGEAVVFYTVLAATTIYTFVMTAPLQFLAGAGIVAFIAIAGHRIWVAVKGFGYKKTIAPIYQTQPTYQPQIIAQPIAQPAVAAQIVKPEVA